jgi:hypothetical protein
MGREFIEIILFAKKKWHISGEGNIEGKNATHPELLGLIPHH